MRECFSHILLRLSTLLVFYSSSVDASEFVQVPISAEVFLPMNTRGFKAASVLEVSDGGAYIAGQFSESLSTVFWDRTVGTIVELRPGPLPPQTERTGDFFSFSGVSTTGAYVYGLNDSFRTALSTPQDINDARQPQTIEGAVFPLGISESLDAIWVETELGFGPSNDEVIRMSLGDVNQQHVFAEALGSAGFNVQRFRATSFASGPDTGFLVVNSSVTEPEPSRDEAEYVPLVWKDDNVFQLSFPTLDDSGNETDNLGAAVTAVSPDGDHIAGKLLSDHPSLRFGAGHPVVWHSLDGETYVFDVLGCSADGLEVEEKGCTILAAATGLLAGSARLANGDFIALAWGKTRSPFPFSHVLRLAGLATEIDGWTLQTVEAFSSDGQAVVGFGLDSQGEGAAWLATSAVPFTTLLAADCDSSLEHNARDLVCVATLAQRDVILDELNTLPGDLDGDGEVAFEDFLLLSKNFGNPSASYAEGNVDLEGGVEFSDFLLLAKNFGSSGPTEAVPEPTHNGLLWTSMLMLVFRWSRTRRSDVDFAPGLLDLWPHRGRMADEVECETDRHILHSSRSLPLRQVDAK